MERTDHSTSCCRQYNVHAHHFFLAYCNCDTVLYLYKMLRKDTADSLTSLPMTKRKRLWKVISSRHCAYSYSRQLEERCIVCQSSSGENEILQQ